MTARFLTLLLCALWGLPAYSASFDYHLQAEKIAADTYVFIGKREDFNRVNGGNIVNTGFIVTQDGVIVIDTGPSLRYGQQMLKVIRSVTDAPILYVFNSHHHPDHFLGNQVFDQNKLRALSGTIQAMTRDAEPFTDNSYRMSGNWMKGTEPKLPVQSVTADVLQAGDHRIRLIEAGGHTRSDLALFDETTGVLFAGDLVFNQRAATTPHAHISTWNQALDQLESLPFKILVPGHGPVAYDAGPIAETRSYLNWVDATIEKSALRGLDMLETMSQPIPDRFMHLKLVDTEFTRSVSHLFPTVEATVLLPAANNQTR